MSTMEISRPHGYDELLEPYRHKANMCEARDELCSALDNPGLTEEYYTQAACNFVNSCQEFIEAEEFQHAGYRDVAETINYLMMPVTKGEGFSFDLTDKIQEYMNDEGAEKLAQDGLSALPRAITLTMLDTIDSRVSKPLCDEWQKTRGAKNN